MIYVYFLSETSHQDGEYSNSNNIQGRQPDITTEPTDTHIPLEHRITNAVMNVLEDNRHETNRTTQNDASNRMQPGSTIPPNDKDNTNNECVLLEVQIRVWYFQFFMHTRVHLT